MRPTKYLSLSLSLLALSAFAGAVTPVTESWGRLFDLGQGADDALAAMTFDVQGNEYIAMFNQVDPFTNCYVRKYDPYGRPLWTQSTFFDGHAQINAITVDSQSNVLVSAAVSNSSNRYGSVTYKLSPTGVPLWIRNYASPTSLDQGPLAVGCDPSGNVVVASVNYKPDNSQELTIVKYSPSGVQMASAERPEIWPGEALFSKAGHLLVGGPNMVTPGGLWEVFDSAGTYLFGQTIADQKVGNTTSNIAFRLGLDGADNIYVSEVLTVATTGQPTSTSYVLKLFSPNFSPQWVSSSLPGRVGPLQAADPSHIVALATNSPTSQRMDYFGANGVRAWHQDYTKARTVMIDGANGAAVVQVTGLNTDRGFTIQKYLPNGSVDWLETYGPFPAGSSAALDARFIGNSLRVAGNQIQAATGQDILLKTYYEGTCVSGLSFQPNSNSGGGLVSGLVKINTVAPAGGFQVSLTSQDPSALWLPATVTVPAGMTQASFTADASAVDSIVSLEVTATGGVAHSMAYTLNPSLLSSVLAASSKIKGGMNLSGSVTLAAKCGLAGRTVALSSNNAAVTVPPTVKVAPGGTSVSFTIKTSAVNADTPVTITATSNGVHKTTILTIQH